MNVSELKADFCQSLQAGREARRGSWMGLSADGLPVANANLPPGDDASWKSSRGGLERVALEQPPDVCFDAVDGPDARAPEP